MSSALAHSIHYPPSPDPRLHPIARSEGKLVQVSQSQCLPDALSESISNLLQRLTRPERGSKRAIDSESRSTVLRRLKIAHHYGRTLESRNWFFQVSRRAVAAGRRILCSLPTLPTIPRIATFLFFRLIWYFDKLRQALESRVCNTKS